MEDYQRNGFFMKASALRIVVGLMPLKPFHVLILLGALIQPLRAEFILVDVEKGIPPAPIVLFENAPPHSKEAALALADGIERICGQRPQLIEGVPIAMPDRAIWVGAQPSGAKLEFQHPEEILIATSEKNVIIAGRDRWDPKNLVVEGRHKTINGRQQEYGTANAIYTFLQDQLGVRWFWPGELGEDFPKAARIALKEGEHRHHPQFRSRSGLIHYSELGNQGYGKSHDWTRVQRLQLDSLELGGGHGFGDWWDLYHEKHPDYFALQPDGTRSGFPSPRNAKLCASNPGVWKLWLEGVEEQLKTDPNARVFNGSPNDGWASGHCACELCRAWDHPEGEPRKFNWKKYNEIRPATSDRDVTFANKLAEALAKRYPGQDLYVQMLSYGHSRPVPVKAVPADNVIMVSVANFLGRTNLVDRGSTRGDTYRQQFEGWGKVAKHLMWRPNTGSPAGWQQGLPDISTAQTIEDFKFVARNHGAGIFIDAVWEHWATQGPMYYVMAQLTWDPEKDGAAILEDYYQRAFGPAAGAVKAYYEGIETARMAYVAKNGYESGVFAFPGLYTEELLDAARAQLDKAAAAVADGPEIYRKRVAFVKVGYDYTRLTVENIRLMKGYWEKADPAVAERVKKNWETVEQLVAANAPAINWGPVRPITDRMLGLHPDHPDPRKKVKGKGNDLDL